MPSLSQLEEAVAELKREQSEAEVTVIVDATFAHRIDPSELPRFEAAVLQGEYVHPPAGAIGRGDAFLLRVAEKVDGTVLSNDSFQEFHGEHPWLFDRGRLIGATPVPGIGWIFVPRSPVRGPTSRKAVKDSTRAKKQVSKAIAVATKEAVKPALAAAAPAKRSAQVNNAAANPRSGARPVAEAPAAVNDPLTFIGFIASHALGAEVEGQVASYTSHGAVVMVGATQCYVPLGNLADPPPRSARSVLHREETRIFVVQALDPLRRGVELALPGVASVSGKPSDEMIKAEMRISKAPAALGPRRRAAKAPSKVPAKVPASEVRSEAPAKGQAKRPAVKPPSKAPPKPPAAEPPSAEPPAPKAPPKLPSKASATPRSKAPAKRPAPKPRSKAPAKPPAAKPPSKLPAAKPPSATSPMAPTAKPATTRATAKSLTPSAPARRKGRASDTGAGPDATKRTSRDDADKAKRILPVAVASRSVERSPAARQPTRTARGSITTKAAAVGTEDRASQAAGSRRATAPSSKVPPATSGGPRPRKKPAAVSK